MTVDDSVCNLPIDTLIRRVIEVRSHSEQGMIPFYEMTIRRRGGSSGAIRIAGVV